MSNFSRRDALRMMTATLAASTGFAALPLRAQAGGKITVLNWQGYGTDEAWSLEMFSKATGIEVVHDYFSSEAEELTKLRTNPGAYDLVILNAARVAQAASEGLLMPVDLTKVPNAANIDPALLANPNFSQDGQGYAVPWLWGLTGIAVREGVTPPAGWADLADPAYVGRVAMDDDAVFAVNMGALITGQDMNDPKDLDKIKDVLKSLKPNIKLLWSSEDQWNKAFAAGEFDVGVFWSGGAVRSKRNAKLPVDFVAPKEGAIAWVDGLGVPASAPNPDAALAFANWLIDPVFYVEWATKVGAPASANAKALAGLPADDLSAQVHKADRLVPANVMSAVPDDHREAYNNLWQEVKAFYAE
jgi:spermidine/putrescine transport system substrate-binding protein